MRSLLLIALFLPGFTGWTAAQPQLVKDYSFVMEIPSVITVESSPAHTYVLSDTEGMVVFRNKPDTLQWLYSSTGMEQRGYKTTADIRFAYLFGDSRRLTVLEPTSVLGVYSSTLLPAQPTDAKRMDQHLYVALGDKGLGRLSLSTPAAVDSTVDLVERSRLKNERVIDLESSADQLLALVSETNIFVFRESDDRLRLEREIELERDINAIFLLDKTLFGSDKSGNIYEIDNSGRLSRLGSIDEPVTKIEAWNDWLIIRGSSSRLWTSYQNRAPVLWKDDTEAGNHFTVIKDRLWICEYNQMSKIMEREADTGADGAVSRNSGSSYSSELSLRQIRNQTVPYSKPLLLTLELENNFRTEKVKFSYRSSVDNARIRGNSFFWRPGSNEVGQHRFNIIAVSDDGQTDSTSFAVDVRSFNAPPRFAPVRPTTIPVDEEFALPFSATDPDGMNSRLVRFLGVDLPDGAELDETTGEFSWTPTRRQVGEHNFRIIATDQFGAASSLDVTLEVAENIERGQTENNN